MTNQISDKFKLLLVDDEKRMLSSLKNIFLDDDYVIYTANSGEEALSIIKKTGIDAALIDLKMYGMDGLSLLKRLKIHYPQIMVVMLTGHGSVKYAVEAIRAGAVDFIEKPFVPEKITARVEQLYKMWQMDQENQMLKNEIGFRFKYEKLIGQSSRAIELKKMISKVGPSDATVLIQGETGTGKEIVAKAIHLHSLRSKCSFVIVDCTTINDNILESELFGHVKGAFTGACSSNKGLVETANHGTLFLDEIADLPMHIQAKLLRLIQEKEIRAVGSSKSVKVDVRIITATNKDIQGEIAKQTFREDLYYRLAGITIKVPPLRERTDDIHLLIDHLIKKHGADFSVVKSVSREALLLMEKYDWPGNIRELENVICRIMTLSSRPTIEPDDLPEQMAMLSIQRPTPLEDSLDAYEKMAITNALQKSEGNRKRASEILNIGEATLYRKIKRYWSDSCFL